MPSRPRTKADRISEIVIPYTPRPLQRKIHGDMARFSVVICHRRFGKTVFAINNLLMRLMTCPHENPQGAYLAPTYQQAKRVAWSYLQKFAEVIPGVRFWETELRVDIPRSADGKNVVRIWLLGADNPDALRGLYLDDVVFDEYADMRPRIWSEVVRPALSDRKGSATWIGTPRGYNHLHEIHETAVTRMQAGDPDWFSAVYPASVTGVIDAQELEGARSVMSDEQYAQEYECSFEAAIVGSYYGKQITRALDEGRIGEFPLDPTRPVHTFWDLGVDDATSVWLAQPSLDGRWIDIGLYHEAQGQGLPYFARWLQSLPYVYGRHVAPHDIEVREVGTGKSRREIAASLGLRFTVSPRLSIADGVEAVRVTLPRCRFHRPDCQAGIEALRQYRQQWNDRLGRYMDAPLHDWSSHGADAFRTLAMMWDRVGRAREDTSAPLRADTDFSLYG